jgi:nucleoside-diphosphate-sugar epimerase
MSAKPLTLVTGATGFAASHLADLLIERGYPVRALVRRTSNLRWIRSEAEKVLGDVRDRTSLRDAVRGVQWVFHFGGLIRARNSEEFCAVNTRGTRNLYDAFVEEGADPELFTFCSTLAAVGPSNDGEPRTETDPPHPISPYGSSKRAAEDYLTGQGSDRSGPRVVIVRPPAIYGPRDESILKFARAVKRGWVPLPAPPNASFAIIHAEDLATGSLLLGEKGLSGIFHLCDGRSHTWEDVARAIARELQVSARFLRIPSWISGLYAWCSELYGSLSGKPPLLSRGKLKEFRQKSWLSSLEKARREVGFEPRWDLQEGLQETLKWYRTSGWM